MFPPRAILTTKADWCDSTATITAVKVEAVWHWKTKSPDSNRLWTIIQSNNILSIPSCPCGAIFYFIFSCPEKTTCLFYQSRLCSLRSLRTADWNNNLSHTSTVFLNWLLESLPTISSAANYGQKSWVNVPSVLPHQWSKTKRYSIIADINHDNFFQWGAGRVLFMLN